MVNAKDKRCAHEGCSKRPVLNAESCKVGEYCRQHAADSMVGIRGEPCAHKSRKEQPIFGTDSSNMCLYCKQRARGLGASATKYTHDDRVDIRNRRCLCDGRIERPPFGQDGGGASSPCKRLPQDSVVKVKTKYSIQEDSRMLEAASLMGGEAP